MITTITNPTSKTVGRYTVEQVNDRFVVMVPTIKKQARRAFKGYNADRRTEAEQAVIVIAFELHQKLAVQGRLEESYPSPLSRFAIGRYKEGRTGGASSCSTDVTSEHCKALGRSKVKNYGLAHNIADTFESEATATDARYPVHRAVQFKLDFIEGWLQEQTPKDQEIIRLLGMGETPSGVARILGVSPAYICQRQKRYRASWNEYINPPEKSDLIDELRELAEKETA